ncbi:MAG: NAD(P)-dependent oxidoreductase [Akkermansia sp.]
MKGMQIMTCSKKVLVTGATGLIGKELITPLQKEGFDVYALTRSAKENDSNTSVHWMQVDLFDSIEIKKVCEQIKPTYLLNFAWATTEDYLTSNINFDFIKVGLDLLKYFHENGGKRAVYVGTCFEYEFKNEPLEENDTINPQTTYGKCKNYLHQLAKLYCENNDISFGWGRIFYVYGRNEHKSRLTKAIIDRLSKNEEIIIKSGNLYKDYMYSKDIAGAFAKFLGSDVEGAVNICTAQPMSIAEYARTIAQYLGKEHLLVFKNEPSNQPPIIVGNNKRLIQEIDYQLQYNLRKGLKEIL